MQLHLQRKDSTHMLTLQSFFLLSGITQADTQMAGCLWGLLEIKVGVVGIVKVYAILIFINRKT